MDTSCDGPEKSLKILKKAEKLFTKNAKNPEKYLSVQNKKAEDAKNLVKILYDLEKFQINGRNDIPAQLLIEQLDEEQIWQQIELKNDAVLKSSIEATSKLLSANDGRFQLCRVEDQTIHGDSSEEEQQDSDAEEQSQSDTEAEPKSSKRKLPAATKSKKKSIVDDDFFKLNEMAQFLDAEDKKEMKSKDRPGDEEINMHLFNDEASECSVSGGDEPKYQDFFGQPDDDEENDDDDDEEDNTGFDGDRAENPETDEEQDSEGDDDEPTRRLANGAKSTFEMQQEQLQENIAKMENQILSDKPWQLKGEITAESRPQNSLLEDYLEFDVTTRPAPIITEKTTMKLEDIIRQRIRDKAFDDVERKHKPTQTPQEYRKKLILDQEKSKESLAKIYEKEFLKEIDKLDPNADDKEAEEPKEHQEIRKLMQTLFTKLDALSNAHYTPKPAAPELKIIVNTPAINMEEVAPVAVSDRNMLAPEEIKAKAKGDILGKEERSKTDKKRERRMKKQHQKMKRVREEAKDRDRESKGLKMSGKDVQKKMLDKVMKYKNVDKMAVNDDSKHIKSSTSFFSQLQDQVTAPVKVVKMSKKLASKAKNDAKKFKL